DLHQGVGDALHITKTLSELNEALQIQGSRFEEIAMTTKLQAESANEITERNKNIAESTERSKRITFETGAAIYKLSKMIDNYRSTTISKNFIIGQEDIIELNITDHLLWRWRIYNLILGFEDMQESEIGHARDSRLGQWYYGQGKELHSNERAYKELEKPFLEIHDIARKAIAAANSGKKEQAELHLEQLTNTSQIVIDKLQELQKIVVNQKALLQG
ncbi:MAG: CZB domain-containing protein, partial [Lysinibacillus sp.]